MTFSSDMARHLTNAEARLRDVFIASTEEVQKSITVGSEITGAPGQPVDTGQLRGSWIATFLSPWAWQTTTSLLYAPQIEDGIGRFGRLTLRSSVGGFHSVKLTRTGWPRIVDAVTRRRALSEGGAAA